MKAFFISYTGKDKEWATWIAGTLEANEYSVIIQAVEERFKRLTPETLITVL